MKVAELREVLARYDDDLAVVIDDLQHGFYVAPMVQLLSDAHSGQTWALAIESPSDVGEAAQPG